MLTLKDHYALASTLAPGLRDRKLLHGPVRPVWSADARWFWYATRDADGPGHVLVDVARGRKSPLYDARALAAALGAVAGKPVDGTNLALEDLRFDVATSSVEFGFDQKRWRWADGALVDAGVTFSPNEAPAPDGAAAVLLDGPNLSLRRAGEKDVHPLTTDGVPEWGYGDFSEGYGQIGGRLAGLPVRPVVLWSPDSQRLAVFRADQRCVPYNHLVQTVPPTGVRPVLHSYRYPMPTDDQGIALELWFIGRDGARVRAQVEGLESRGFNPLRLARGRWSQDGRFFDLTDMSRDARRVTLWRIDAHSGAAEIKHMEEGPAVVFPAALMSEPPMWRVLEDGRVLFWSQTQGWGHLFVTSADGGPRALTKGPWLVRSILAVDEARGAVVFTASGREPGTDPYYSFVYRVGLNGEGLERLTPEDGHHEFSYGAAAPAAFADPAESMAPDASAFVDVWSTLTEPPRSVLRDAVSGAVIMDLETADPADGWPKALPPREAFTVTALDAEAFPGCADLWGVLFRPAGFDPSKRYPVIDVVYGGPQAPVAGHAWSPPSYPMGYEEQLAALGFVVVVLDGPGTPFRSYAFQRTSYGRMETCGGLPDHVNALRELAATRPWMDLDRVGITGASGGGYATVRALGTFPDFYKVGVALCGNHENSAYIAAWGDIYEGPYDEALYAPQSNTTVAANIQGDLLLVHGEMDDNVHPGMTLQVVDALIKADRNFDLLIVPNGGHAFFLSPYVKRRAFDYFVERLAGLKPPPPAPPMKG